MTSVQVSAQFSTDDLLTAIAKLDLPELDDFTSRVIRLRAQRLAPHIPKNEAELLKRINQGVPFNVQTRYDELAIKRDAETLTAQEYDELLQLTEHIEKVDAERLRNLAELARLRKTSLDALMDELDIRTSVGD